MSCLVKVLLKRFHLNGHSTGPKSHNYDIIGGLKRPLTSDSSGKENLSEEAPPLSEAVYLFVWRGAGAGGSAFYRVAVIRENSMDEMENYSVNGGLCFLSFIYPGKGVRCCLKSWRECH